MFLALTFRRIDDMAVACIYMVGRIYDRRIGWSYQKVT